MLDRFTNTLLGEYPAFAENPLSFVEERVLGRNTPVPAQFGLWKAVFVARPSAFRHILVDAADRYGRGTEQVRLRPLFAEGPLAAAGRRWGQAGIGAGREAMFGTFPTGQRLAMSVLAQEVGRLSFRIGETVDLHTLMGQLTMRMVVASLFHEVIDENTAAALAHAGLLVHQRLSTAMWRTVGLETLLPTAESREFRDALAILEALVARFASQPKGVLAAMRPLEQAFGQRALRDEAVALLVNGFETTAVAASWLIYWLACRPDLVHWLQAETDGCMAGAWGIEPTRLGDMPRTRAVVQEILRVFPSVWWFARTVLADDEIDGCPVSRGTTVLGLPWALHRQPDLWEDAECLEPQRFLEKGRGVPGGADSFTYLPFGAGPRAGLGGQMATTELMAIAAMTVSAFDIVPLSGPIEWLRPRAGVTLELPEGGLSVQVALRHQLRRAA